MTIWMERFRRSFWGWWLGVGWILLSFIVSKPEAFAEKSHISSLLKDTVLKRIVENREVMSHAVLHDPDPKPGSNQDRRYEYYASMLIRATPKHTQKVLTQYELYEKFVPFVDQARFDSKKNLLELAGGIWNFKLRSFIQFKEVGKTAIHFRIVKGSFQGMTGKVLFEPWGERDTLVYLGGEQVGKEWPPQFILEKGAEVVFSITGKKMRSLVEEKKVGETQPGNSGLPQPQKSF